MADAKGARPQKSKRSEESLFPEENFNRAPVDERLLRNEADAEPEEGEPLSLAEELAEEAEQERA